MYNKNYRNIFFLLGCILINLLGACSQDTILEDPYKNWDIRNEHFLDSIINIARLNTSNEWEIHQNYKIQNDLGLGEGSIIYPNTQARKDDSVYMKIIDPPLDVNSPTPLYTDSVYVYYRGWTIDGSVFDESYKGILNTDIASPIVFHLPSLESGVEGWITVLQNMKVGQRVEAIIPAKLGYENQAQPKIPAGSVLIFDIKLEKIVHPKGPDDRKLKSDKASN